LVPLQAPQKVGHLKLENILNYNTIEGDTKFDII